jgi:hypothetical protein
MTYNNTRSGPNNVAEYMASGLPWSTSSNASTTPMRYDFPFVTNNITLTNISGATNLWVGYTQFGVQGSNKHVVPPGATVTLNYRVKTLYIRSSAGTVDYSLSAGLTMIDVRNFPLLTGSAVYNSGNDPQSRDYGYSTGLG